MIDDGEECDDGDASDGDGCSADCKVEEDYACIGQPSRCDEIAVPAPGVDAGAKDAGSPPPPAACGDGMIDDGEDCDDGNDADRDGCSADCEVEDGYGCVGAPSDCATRCGDGVAAGDEDCDDGNLIDDRNGCDTDCTRNAECGNGALESLYETCDDGNATDDGNGCGDDCMRNDECGNSSVEPLYEECDDGNAVDDANGCTASCQRYDVCGNGVVEVFEMCDDGVNDGSYGSCHPDCTPTRRCGDSIIDAGDGETCDDGNATNDANGCDAACHRNDSCGNSKVEGLFEDCDDGNTTDDANGCDGACRFNNTCGNGNVELQAEECDDGTNGGSYGTCNADCTLAPRCGDSMVQRGDGEECDDGNTTDDANGCDGACRFNNTCGNAVVESQAEECDDGTNDSSYETCNADCTLGPRCGDGLLQASDEQCEDGNAYDDYNGCDATCACYGATCHGACVNPLIDADNCGGCDMPCATGEVCVGGVCCAHCNLLRGALNGAAPAGNARVVQIDAYGDVSVYEGDLTANCNANWEPTGTLCDEGGENFTDFPYYSFKANGDSAATWYSGANGAGVLVVDMGTVREIATLYVFQMFADGTTTAVRFASHPETRGTFPGWDDDGWALSTSWVMVGPGVQVPQENNDIVGAPTWVTLPAPIATRYLRIEVVSPQDDYIELRSVKAFGP